jgi:hypothetical protein
LGIVEPLLGFHGLVEGSGAAVGLESQLVEDYLGRGGYIDGCCGGGRSGGRDVEW